MSEKQVYVQMHVPEGSPRPPPVERPHGPLKRQREEEARARAVGGALGGLLLGAALVGGGPAALIGGVLGLTLAAMRNAELSGERKPGRGE